MRLGARFTCSASILVLLCFSVLPAAAQVNTVDLSVAVLDRQAATVAGAAVSVKHLGTGAVRALSSDSKGLAQFVGLPPGRYEVTVEASGFARLVQPELVLNIGQGAEYHAHLRLQSGSETIIVSDSTEMIEVRRTAV